MSFVCSFRLHPPWELRREREKERRGEREAGQQKERLGGIWLVGTGAGGGGLRAAKNAANSDWMASC